MSRADDTGTAAARWAQALAALAIPEPVLAAAPESPWVMPPERFAAPDVPEPSIARDRALALLAGVDDPVVLDVGCGGGAASMALVPPAVRVVGVDERATMLALFSAAAEARGVAHEEVEGRWPDVADEVERLTGGAVDLTVCHHVLYNVPDLPAFVRRLVACSRHGVVIEITGEHPTAWTRPLWRRFHGWERPGGPYADDVLAVLAEAGVAVTSVDRRARRTRPWDDEAARVAFVRRRLCLPASRDPEVAAALAELGDQTEPGELVTITLAGGAPH